MSKSRIDYSLIEKEAYQLMLKINKDVSLEDIEDMFEKVGKDSIETIKNTPKIKGIDYSLIEKEAKELILSLKLKQNIDIEDLDNFINKSNKDKESKSDNMKMEGLSLKPKPPSFAIPNQNNKENKLITSKKELDLGKDLFVFDLFEIVGKNLLKKFGLQDITLEDLKNNNITRALIIVNRKGDITNIITNKSANKIFVDNLLLNTLKYGVDFKIKPKL